LNSEKEVGHGGSGKIFKGTYGSDNQIVAVKIIQEDSVQKDKWKELDILREVVHPNIVRYFGFEFNKLKGVYAIVMELAETDLDKWLKEDMQKPKKMLKNILVHVSRGLQALDNLETPIVHRDMKPSNILICGGTEVVAKIADFGLSRIILPNKAGITTQNPGLGTSGWMSPEQLQGSETLKLTTEVDIFSFGLVVNFILTDRKHLYAKSQSESEVVITCNILLDKRTWHQSPQFSPVEYEGFLKCVTKKDPSKRPTINEVMCHPLMWDYEKSFQFIEAVTTILKRNEPFTEYLRKKLNDIFSTIWKTAPWESKLCPIVKNYFLEVQKSAEANREENKHPEKYDSKDIADLIEFIYDRRYYFRSQEGNLELTASNVFGEKGTRYVEYFLERFPELVPTLFELLQQVEYQELVRNQLCPLYCFFSDVRPDAFTFC